MPTRGTKRGDARTPLDGDYDVLICGASFAGLAVARELAGSGARVLVIDRYEIGERQTSACGIPTEWLQAMDLMGSHRQTFAGCSCTRRTGPRGWSCPGPSPPSTTRELCWLLWEQSDAEFETAKVEGRSGDTVHTDRGDLTAPAGGRRARLAARARERLSAARRAAVARARGAPVGRRRRAGDLDRPPLRAGRLRLELPRGRRAAHRRRLLRSALPRQGHDRAAGRGPRARPGPLPGQLDPAQAARRHRGRRLLRGRLGRALPAAHGRGHPHRLLLRHRLRARAARGRRGAPDDRAGAGALRRLLRRARVEVPLRCCDTQQARPAACRRGCWRSRWAGCGRRRFVDWSFGHYLAIAPPEFARASSPPLVRRRPSTARRRKFAGQKANTAARLPD